MQVKDALDKGAHLLLKGGCTDGPGSFYEPVVLGNVNHEMLLTKDESFGPIVGLQSVVSDDEALALMQDNIPIWLNSQRVYRECGPGRTTFEAINVVRLLNCSDRVSPQLPGQAWSFRHRFDLLRCRHRNFLRPKAWYLRRP